MPSLSVVFPLFSHKFTYGKQPKSIEDILIVRKRSCLQLQLKSSLYPGDVPCLSQPWDVYSVEQ